VAITVNCKPHAIRAVNHLFHVQLSAVTTEQCYISKVLLTYPQSKIKNSNFVDTMM